MRFIHIYSSAAQTEWMNEWGSPDRDHRIHFATYSLLDIFHFVFSLDKQQTRFSLCVNDLDENARVGSQHQHHVCHKKHIMCQYLLRLQFGKKQETKKELLKTLWQMTKLLGACCCRSPNFSITFGLPSWSWHSRIKYRSHQFTCASATSLLYRLKYQYWSKLRNDIRLIFFLLCVRECARVEWFLSSSLACAFIVKRKHHIYESNNSHTATGSTKCLKCSQNVCIFPNKEKKTKYIQKLKYPIHFHIQLYLRQQYYTTKWKKKLNVNIYQSTKLKFKLFDCFKI